MKKGKKISNSARARRNFKSWDQTGIPEVRDSHGNVYHKMIGEKFVESPILSKKYGKNYFYISNRGHLISFKKQTPTLKTPDRTDRGRYTIENLKAKKNDHYLIHRLVAEAFDAYAYGLATKDNDVHHRRRYRPDKSIVFNNNPEYLEYVTERVHKLLNRLQERPRNERTELEELEIMQALAYIAGIEEPDRITLVLDDPEDTAIFATDEIKLSIKAYIQLTLMIEAWICADSLKQQNIKESLKYPVFCTITLEAKRYTAVAVYEFKPEEKKTVLVPCTDEQIKSIYNSPMKDVTDDLLRTYYLRYLGYQFTDTQSDTQQEPQKTI